MADSPAKKPAQSELDLIHRLTQRVDKAMEQNNQMARERTMTEFVNAINEVCNEFNWSLRGGMKYGEDSIIYIYDGAGDNVGEVDEFGTYPE